MIKPIVYNNNYHSKYMYELVHSYKQLEYGSISFKNKILKSTQKEREKK